MAVVKNLMVRVGADFSSITTQSKKAAGSVKTMSKDVKSSCSGMSAAFSSIKSAALKITAAVAAAKAVASAVSEAVDLYQAQAEAETTLAQVMRNTMGATDAEIKKIKELTSAQQALGVIGDEVQLAGAQELATYLELSSSLETLIPVMNDMIAQQYGLEATQENAANIATMLGKVMEGQTSGLSRYGYYFTEAQEAILKYGTEAERAATLAEVIEESVGGVNAALAQTPSGQMQQLKNTLGDIKEELGSAAMTVVYTMIPVLNKLVEWLGAAAAYCKKLANNFAYIFGGTVKSNAASVATASAATADSVEDVAEAYDDVTSSSKKAQKQLMGIDTLNRLSSTSSGTSGSALAETSDDLEEYLESLDLVEEATEETEQKVSKKVEDMRATWTHFLDLFRDPSQWWSDEKSIFANFFDALIHGDGGIIGKEKSREIFAAVKKWVWDDGILAAMNEIKTLWAVTVESVITGWNETKDWAVEIGIKIKDKAVSLWQQFKEDWGTAKQRVVEFGLSIKTKVGELWNSIRSAFSGKMLSLKITYTYPTSNWARSILSALGLSGWPHLSFAAKGGIVDSATLFGSTVVGEAGKEAIIPLERNTGWLDGIASRLEEGFGSGLESAINSGNNEQNSLLKEQNRLLRELVGKDLTIKPSAALGQVVSKSASLYARAAG